MHRGCLRVVRGEAFRSFVAILVVGFVCLDVVFVLARIVGVRAVLYFPDTPLVIVAFVGFAGTAAACWDALLLVFGAVRQPVDRRRGLETKRRWYGAWRDHGFFSLGVWPLSFIVVTIYFLLGTSNVSNMSLRLLQGATRWNDGFFWGIEEPFLRMVTGSGVDVRFWELIYNSGWQAEMLALLAVLVVSRSPARAAAFCVSFTLLFYLGRLLGLATPVLGPAFHVPEVFAYLDGSVTSWMMERVEATIRAGPDASASGAVMLGGVAAMPSLHVGMISIAAWWLGVSRPRIRPLLVGWVGAVWASTVMLGWHYALDGAGGIATAAACIALTGAVLRWMRVGGMKVDGMEVESVDEGSPPSQSST
jgi:hypothetical protein